MPDKAPGTPANPFPPGPGNNPPPTPATEPAKPVKEPAPTK
jgi:hypothetical protein